MNTQMKRNVIGLFCGVLASSPVFAGAANIELQCGGVERAHSSIRLSGEIPPDFAEFTLSFAAGESKIRWTNEKDQIATDVDLKRRVFRVVVTPADGAQFRFHAIPGSIKYEGDPGRQFSVTFDGLIETAPDPTASGGTVAPGHWLKNIRVKCSAQKTY